MSEGCCEVVYETPAEMRARQAREEFAAAEAARMAEDAAIQAAAEWEAYEEAQQKYEEEVAQLNEEFERTQLEQEFEQTAEQKQAAELELAAAIERKKRALESHEEAANEAARIEQLRKKAEEMAKEKRDKVEMMIKKAAEFGDQLDMEEQQAEEEEKRIQKELEAAELAAKIAKQRIATRKSQIGMHKKLAHKEARTLAMSAADADEADRIARENETIAQMNARKARNKGGGRGMGRPEADPGNCCCQ